MCCQRMCCQERVVEDTIANLRRIWIVIEAGREFKDIDHVQTDETNLSYEQHNIIYFLSVLIGET